MAEQRALLTWTPPLNTSWGPQRQHKLWVFSPPSYFWPLCHTGHCPGLSNTLLFKAILLHCASCSQLKLQTLFHWSGVILGTSVKKMKTVKPIRKRFVSQLKRSPLESSGIHRVQKIKWAGIVFNLNTIIYTVLVTFHQLLLTACNESNVNRNQYVKARCQGNKVKQKERRISARVTCWSTFLSDTWLEWERVRALIDCLAIIWVQTRGHSITQHTTTFPAGYVQMRSSKAKLKRPCKQQLQ